MANNFTKSLQKLFGFGVYNKKTSLGTQKKTKEVIPIDKTTFKKLKLTSEAQRLWNWYTDQTNDNSQTLKNRMDRYKDLDYMIYNDTTISMAAELYADEVAQIDHDFQLIGISAKNKKVAIEIRKLLDQWNIDQQYIRECALNLTTYGDAVDVVDSDKENGIISITPIDVKDLTNRLEFKLSEIKKQMKLRSTKDVNSSSINQFLTDIDAKEQTTLKNSYSSYLLGFTINGEYVNPWQVNHYRLFSRKTEFWPYGRSMFINLIGPFRQYKASLNLMALTRAMSFPKEVYEVETDPTMTGIDKWSAVNEARQEFENLGVLNRKNDEFSIGDEIWLPKGLINHSTIKNEARPENIADIELLRDNLIMGTRIPKGYLIIDKGGWGTSSQSLLQQSKPFGRAVYYVQSAILKNLSHLIRLHFLMTGQFEKEFTEFQLSLNFPVIEEASDRLRMKTDSLRLANDIIDNIKNSLGLRNSEVPAKVINSIFSKFSFLSPEDVELVTKALSAEASKNESSELNKIEKRLNEEVINNAYFESIKNMNFKEGIMNQRHYYTSSENTIGSEFSCVYEFYRKDELSSKLED